MSVIHFESRKALAAFRKYPAALAVYWVYLTRRNHENRAWPTLRGLAEETGWGIDAVADARDFLEAIEAIVPDPDYVRPQWRSKSPAQLIQLLNLDHTRYYYITGYAIINGEKIPLLYIPPENHDEEPVTEDDEPPEDAQSESQIHLHPMSDTAAQGQSHTEDSKDIESIPESISLESSLQSNLPIEGGYKPKDRKAIARRRKLPPRVRGIPAIQEDLMPHPLEVVIAQASRAKGLNEKQKRAIDAPLMAAQDGKLVSKPSLKQLWDQDPRFADYVHGTILGLMVKMQSGGSTNLPPSRDMIIKELLRWEKWEEWQRLHPPIQVMRLEDDPLMRMFNAYNSSSS